MGKLPAKLILAVLVIATSPAILLGIDVIWAGQDLSFGPTPMPEGRLLTPHHLYWDSVIFSGVKISLDGKELEPTGIFNGWLAGEELKAEFPVDYKITELAICVEGKVSLKSPEVEAEIIRIPLRKGNGQWIRYRLKQPSIVKTVIFDLKGSKVRSVQIWGKGSDYKSPDPIYPVREKFPIAFESLPAADKTSFSDHIYWSWRRKVWQTHPELKDIGCVWAQHYKWKRISAEPILPDPEVINKPIKITMARNEYEGALITLTSLKDRAGEDIHDSGIYKNFKKGDQEITIKLSDIEGPSPDKVKLTLRIAAVLRSQLFGTVVGPLFSADNMLDPARMRYYFTNGDTIVHFPKILLRPCGSQVFWLEVKTEDAEPGIYRAMLTAEPGVSVPVEIEVLPVKLPTPYVWVHVWHRGIDGCGTKWPFYRLDTLENTVKDKLSRGITSYYGFPEPYTDGAIALKLRKDVTFFCHPIPYEWVHLGYTTKRNRFENMTEEEKEKIKEYAKETVSKYKALGVDTSQWYGEFWDEPGDRNADLIAMMAQIVKEADPSIQIYVNPAMPKDVNKFKLMSKHADLFVPFWGNWFNGPEWLAENNSSHKVNAFYAVQGCNRSELNEELVGHYRILAWQVYKLGMQGWGFYSYAAPRGDPYTDYNPPGSETDYQVVYPGPNGPVPSRQAEAFRDGWEDYRLLKYIEENGSEEAKAVMKEVLEVVPLGREPLTSHVDFEELKLKLLRAAAKK